MGMSSSISFRDFLTACFHMCLCSLLWLCVEYFNIGLLKWIPNELSLQETVPLIHQRTSHPLCALCQRPIQGQKKVYLWSKIKKNNNKGGAEQRKGDRKQHSSITTRLTGRLGTLFSFDKHLQTDGDYTSRCTRWSPRTPSSKNTHITLSAQTVCAIIMPTTFPPSAAADVL